MKISYIARLAFQILFENHQCWVLFKASENIISDDIEFLNINNDLWLKI